MTDEQIKEAAYKYWNREKHLDMMQRYAFTLGAQWAREEAAKTVEKADYCCPHNLDIQDQFRRILAKKINGNC